MTEEVAKTKPDASVVMTCYLSHGFCSKRKEKGTKCIATKEQNDRCKRKKDRWA